MTQPDPHREPKSDTVEKKSITKAHEEFIGDEGPSMTKEEYERHQDRERQKAREKSDENQSSQPKTGPIEE